MAPRLDSWSLTVKINLIVDLTECGIIQETPMGAAVERIVKIT